MRKPFQIAGRDGWHAEVKYPDGHAVRRSFDKHGDAKDWLTEKMARAKAQTAPLLGGPAAVTLAQMLAEYAKRFTLVKGGYAAELGRINHYLVGAGLPRLQVVVDGTKRRMVEVESAPERALPRGFQGHLTALLKPHSTAP